MHFDLETWNVQKFSKLFNQGGGKVVIGLFISNPGMHWIASLEIWRNIDIQCLKLEYCSYIFKMLLRDKGKVFNPRWKFSHRFIFFKTWNKILNFPWERLVCDTRIAMAWHWKGWWNGTRASVTTAGRCQHYHRPCQTSRHHNPFLPLSISRNIIHQLDKNSERKFE